MKQPLASGASGALLESDTQSPSDPALRLSRLVEHIHSRPQRLAHPARRLSIEVDGEILAHGELGSEPISLELSNDAVSLSLRDENAQLRAHVLLSEQELRDAAFDSGRLLLSIERSGQQPRLVLRAAT